MSNAICLASGGLDSSTCLYLLKKQSIVPIAVFIDYGQLNKDREYSALLKVCNDLKIEKPKYFDFSSYANNIHTGLTDNELHVVEDAFTPCRNLIFLVTAAAYAHSLGCSKIVMGLLSESTILFPDQSGDFLEKTQIAIEAALGNRIEILTPLRDFSKREVQALADNLNVISYYSCHKGSSIPCGECIACKEYEGDK